MEEDKILVRWHEYISELYDDNRGKIPQGHTKSELMPVTRREVKFALKGMALNKAPEPVNIFQEKRVASGEAGLTELTSLTNMMYQEALKRYLPASLVTPLPNSEQINHPSSNHIHTNHLPEKINNSIFITLPKDSGTAKFEKHRTISLMSHVTKLVLRVLMNRHRAWSLMEISQVQYGCMPDRGTRNAIFVSRRSVECSIQKMYLHVSRHSIQ